MAESTGGGLLLGGSGQLGTALADWLRRAGRPVLAPVRSELDLLGASAIARRVAEAQPAWVINAAAFTDVAGAERLDNREAVLRLNRDLPALLAQECRRSGARLVHVSTDYVFDGAASRPYREDDSPAPLQTYGISKLEGERAVLDANPDALILRTSTLFGPAQRARPNYVDAIRLQARVQTVIEVVELPVASPTFAADLAWALLRLLDARATGIVHVVNDGACSRLDLARAIVEEDGRAASVEVRSCAAPSGDLRRPAYSALDMARYEAIAGARLRPWRLALAEHLRRSTL